MSWEIVVRKAQIARHSGRKRCEEISENETVDQNDLEQVPFVALDAEYETMTALSALILASLVRVHG